MGVHEYNTRVAVESLKHYGATRQLWKLQEECGELIAAVARYQDANMTDRTKLARRRVEVIEEAGDVMLMLKQVFIIMHAHEPSLVSRKYNNLARRMDEEFTQREPKQSKWTPSAVPINENDRLNRGGADVTRKPEGQQSKEISEQPDKPGE